MYRFTDTNQPPQGMNMPKEAPMINGVYLEEIVPGYRTLTVQGREAMTAEVETQSEGKRDGSMFLSRRYPERVIRIRYQLISRTAADFREAYNMLAAALHIKSAQLIFNDEPDKFYIGIPGQLEAVEPGKNAVVSEIEFICPDPYKYSVKEYEVEQDEDGNLSCRYGGTFPARPSFSAQFLEEEYTDENEQLHDGSCGCLLLTNDKGITLQFGDPDEADGRVVGKTETLVEAKLRTADAWTPAVAALWPLNDASAVAYGTKTGTIGMIPSVANPQAADYYVGPTAYGSSTGWHGPAITCELPEDSGEEAGAENFMFQCSLKCSYGASSGDTNQLGGFVVYIHDESRNKLAGIRVWKTATGSKGKIIFIAENENKDEVEISFGRDNKYFGSGKDNMIKITKTGSKVVLYAGGLTRTRECPSIETSVAKFITFQFLRNGTKPPLSWNGLYSWKFNKLDVDTWEDEPNKFTVGDLLEIDCEDGTVRLNNMLTPALGEITNDWEGFSLVPGDNTITAESSEWCLDPPAVKMKYREVYL